MGREVAETHTDVLIRDVTVIVAAYPAARAVLALWSVSYQDTCH